MKNFSVFWGVLYIVIFRMINERLILVTVG